MIQGSDITNCLKVRIIISVITFSLAFPVSFYSQKITIAYTNQSLSAVLNNLSKRYNIKIAFDAEVADKITVNQSFQNTNLDELLSSLAGKSGLRMQLMGDVYMIIPEFSKLAVKEEVPEVQKVKIKPQKTFVYGLVKDHNTGEALPFASIYISQGHIGTLSNNEGYFRIETSSTDSIYFAVNYLGYIPYSCKAMPQVNPQLITINLNAKLEELQTIVVQDKIELFDNTGMNIDRIKFSPSKMYNIPSLSELDISQPLQMLPGIDATNENAGGFIIRKSMPDKTLLVYDGFTVYHMNHFFGAFSSINTKAVKDIQVYKSGFDAQYGGSAAGLIEITGKSGNTQKTIVDVGIDMLAVDSKIEVPVVKDKCTFLFAGRRSYTDYLQTPLYVSLFENARYDFTSYYLRPPAAFKSSANDPVYFYDDFNTKLTVNTSEKSKLSISGFRSYDNLKFDQLKTFPMEKEKTSWGTQGGSIRWAGELNHSWSTEVIAGCSKTTFNYNLYDSIERVRQVRLWTITNHIIRGFNINSWLNNASLFWNNSVHLTQGNDLDLGLQVQHFNSVYNYNLQALFNTTVILDTSRDYNKQVNLISFFAQYILTGEKWKVSPGIRLNRYNLINKHYPEFRFSALYKVNQHLTFKANAGNYFQFVNKVNLVRNGDFRSAWVISDGNRFPVVSSYMVSFGTNINITSTLNLDVEAYGKRMNNLISSIAEYKLTVNNEPKLANLNYKYNSDVIGTDILLKQSWTNYQIWLSYSISKATNDDNKYNNGASYPSDLNQLQEIKLLNLLKIKNWVATITGIYGSGITWDEYTLDNNLQLSQQYQRNSMTCPPYYRVDAGLNYQINIGHTELKLGSNFFNVFNNKNIIKRFEKLSETPLQDLQQNIYPMTEMTVYGLGFSYNFFINYIF